MSAPVAIDAALVAEASTSVDRTSSSEPSPIQPPPDAAFEGGLTPEQVRRTVMAQTQAIRSCYAAVAKDHPDLRGSVAVAWRINEDGTVAGAAIAGSTINNAEVEACVERTIRKTRFPPSARPTNIASYPFRFGAR
jgi:TonB family protein